MKEIKFCDKCNYTWDKYGRCKCANMSFGKIITNQDNQMKIGQTYTNKHSKKIATIVNIEDGYVWFKIDGIETCLPQNIFKQVYLCES